MHIQDRVASIIRKNGIVTAREVAEHLKVSRVYSHRLLHKLCEEGVVVLVGKTNRAHYILASNKKALFRAQKTIQNITLRLKNNNLSESEILKKIENETGIFLDVNENIHKIFSFAFTEMLNNAIDHSHSKKITIECRRTTTAITFIVRDFGVGIFKNVCQKFHLPGTLDAIQEILKGKTTTAPKEHSGQGVFFTSKIGDIFIVDSFEKKLTVNNLLPDIFISDRKIVRGTRISFSIHLSSRRKIIDVFNAFTGDDGDLGFDKTKVVVKLFKFGKILPSRSEAKRVTMNLEHFKHIELDFKGVDTIGQAFADEIYRVWHSRYKNIHLSAVNASDIVLFMIRRAGGEE